MANPCRAVETTHVQRFMDSPRAKAFRWPIGMEKFLVLVVEGFSPVCSGTGLCPFCSRAGVNRGLLLLRAVSGPPVFLSCIRSYWLTRLAGGSQAPGCVFGSTMHFLIPLKTTMQK